MKKYKCGHKTEAVIFLDSNELSISAYEDWSNTVGVFGTGEKCFNCYLKELKEK